MGGAISFEINGPDNIPCVCLFTEAQFGGDVQCFGVGGDKLPTNVQKTSQSLQLHGGATVWIYAQSYGDAGGAEITSGANDLSKTPYGASGNFNQIIMAMLVKGP